MKPEPKITGPNLVHNISTFIQRFVQFDDPNLYLLTSLWVVSTYLTQTFQYSGYLCVHSRIPGSGKTRLLEILELLVHRPESLISPTEAVIFRTAKDTTQLLDEGDGWKDGGESVRSVLNVGFSKGKYVTRMVKRNNNYVPEKFDVFGPKAIAGLNLNKILDRTTLERTFTIELKKRKRSQKVEKFRPRSLKNDYSQIQSNIKEWLSETVLVEIQQVYDSQQIPAYLEDFSERTIDIAEPLAAILEIAYRDSAELESVSQSLKQAIVATRTHDREILMQIEILRQLAELTQGENPLVGNATELHSRCNGLADKIRMEDISRTLRDHGFETRSIRKDGESLKRYCLPQTDLERVLGDYSYHKTGL